MMGTNVIIIWGLFYFLLFDLCFLPLISCQISDDGRYAVLSITEGCEPVNQLWYCDLQQLPDGIKGLYVTTTYWVSLQ